MSRFLVATCVTVLFVAGPVLAADDKPLPPPNARKLSEIIAKVEQRDGFRYVKEVDWDSGAYTVTYYTSDKAKVEITYDPVTAEPK
ncbi:PepSY domain-containing protein [Mesorhizobium sp. ORM6]